MLPLVFPIDQPADICFADRFVDPAAIAINSAPGCLTQQSKNSLQLDFKDLPSFTAIRDQYQNWGIMVEGAMAIRPSNPAFADAKQSSGLLPIAHHQTLTIRFQQVRQWVSLSLAGAQQITLRAYSAGGDLLAEQQAGQSDYRQLHQTALTYARHQMQLAVQAIGRIEIYSNAPFLLFDLACG
jgi:hypothetical protein